MMNELLPSDIIQTILLHYCKRYNHLIRATCRLWADCLLAHDAIGHDGVSGDIKESMDVYDDVNYYDSGKGPMPRFNPKHVALLYFAYNGKLHVLQWIYELKKQQQQHHSSYVSLSSRWMLVSHLMIVAAKGGHEHLVRHCHDVWGADDVDTTMACAAFYNHEHIMRICHDEWGATKVNHAMLYAAWNGHEHLVRFCHDVWNAWNVAATMIYAACGGHISIVRWCHETVQWFSPLVANLSMLRAAASGHMDIVRLCREQYGANNVNVAMVCAAEHGHEDIVKLCHDEYGADQIIEARTAAVKNKHDSIVQLCESWLGLV